MVDVQTLLVSSVTARAGFLLVFLLYSFRPGATTCDYPQIGDVASTFCKPKVLEQEESVVIPV